MKKDNKNKELYNKILNSESNEELDKIKVTINAYRHPDCALGEDVDFGGIDAPLQLEGTQNNADGSPYTQFVAGATDGPRTLTVSLPGWLTMRLVRLLLTKYL